MAGKAFTKNQKRLLKKNLFVEDVDDTRITYTDAFKSYYIKKYLEGKKPTEIFVSAGFDPIALGNKRIERASSRWRKLYAEGLIDIKDDDDMSTTTIIKKRRGRPKRNPLSVEAEKNIPKRKPGRPRKNPIETTPNKINLNEQNINSEENSAISTEITVTKKRGRPRKNPIETVDNTLPKRRRGRPRKQVVEVKDITPNVIETTVNAIPPTVKPVQSITNKEEAINERPITALVKAINRLTREVNSLKRLVAGKKKVNY